MPIRRKERKPKFKSTSSKPAKNSKAIVARSPTLTIHGEPRQEPRNQLIQNGAHQPLLDSPLETSGGPLPDGQITDLIIDEVSGRLQLLYFDGTRYRSGDRIQTPMGTFVPVSIDPAILRATVLPTKALPYGTTKTLCADVQDALSGFGFLQDVARAATLSIFPTWFRDPSLPAPCLIITGPSAEANLLLQLLGCLVRRGLRIFEMDKHDLPGVIRQLQPTILVDAKNYTRPMLRKLFASCAPRTYVAWKGSLVEFSFPKVVYLGAAPMPDISCDSSLHIHVSPSRYVIPVLGEKQRREITAAFQPRFVDYYFRNSTRVYESEFDLPALGSEARVIARSLGRCFEGAPEVQAQVQPLIQEREADFRAARWIDPTCVVIEALLDMCHRPKTDVIYVGRAAKTASGILKGRGSREKLGARGAGAIFDRLGLVRKRKGPGYRINLTENIKHAIHRRALEYQVAAVEEGISQCAICKEVFNTSARVTEASQNVHRGQSP